MNSKDIAFVIAGDLHRNIRALKQLRSLSDGGYTVKAFHLGGSATHSELPPGVSEEVVLVRSGRGPLYFKRLHQAFWEALSQHSARLFHASDLYTLAACAASSAHFNTLYSFDSRELYAHVAATKGRPWVRWWWTRLERKLLPGSAGTFAVSESIANHLAAKYGIPKPTVVYNVPERVPLAEAQEADHISMAKRMDDLGYPSNVPILVHLGQMKRDRGCEQLVLAMKHVPEAQLVFLGYGPQEAKLKEMVASMHLQDRIHFIPPVGPRAVRNALQGATIGVTMLEDTCLNHRYALPNKLFDYVHAGLPVLSSNLKEVERVVREFDLGRSANPSDPEDIARVIHSMLEDPKRVQWSKNSLKAAETFSWDKATQHFMLEINRVLSQTQYS